MEFFLTSCGQNPIVFLYKNGNSVFTHTPIDYNNISAIMPLGHLRPPQHTLPANHIYFCFPNTNVSFPVYAPAAGVVSSIDNYTGQDYKISVSFTATSEYYMDHVMVNSDIHVGDFVSSGKVIGTTSDYASCVDLGLINIKQAPNSFVNKDRYYSESLYADCPLKYYEADLQSRLFTKVNRTGTDKYGKICYDIAGRLIGNWVSADLPVHDKLDGPVGEAKTIAFVYHYIYADMPVISIGNMIKPDFTGVWKIQTNTIKFEDASVDSGNLEYELYYNPENSPSNTNTIGLLLVKMTTDNKIKVELFTNGSLSAQSNYTFTSNVFYFKR